jgi:hypothetical protein
MTTPPTSAQQPAYALPLPVNQLLRGPVFRAPGWPLRRCRGRGELRRPASGHQSPSASNCATSRAQPQDSVTPAPPCP